MGQSNKRVDSSHADRRTHLGPVPQSAVGVLTVSVLFVCVMSIPLTGCDDSPPPIASTAVSVPPPVPFKIISGEGWTLEVPVDWELNDGGLWMGPDRANISVASKFYPLPLDLVTDATRADLGRGLNKFVVRSEKMGKIGRLDAYEVLSEYETPGGKTIAVTTVLVDGGRRKHLLTLTVLAADYPNDATIFRRIVQSFDAPYEPVESSPP